MNCKKHKRHCHILVSDFSINVYYPDSDDVSEYHEFFVVVVIAAAEDVNANNDVSDGNY